MVYDVAGNQIRYIDEKGNSIRYRYGPCSRLLEREDRLGNIVKYEWRTEPGQLRAIINEVGDTFTLTWDDAGRITKENSFDGAESSICYDAAGNSIGVTNGAGEELRIERDLLGRQTHLKASTGEEHFFKYDMLGKLIEARTGEHVVELIRDPLGRITSERQDEYVVKVDYDDAGNWGRISSSLGEEIVHIYDNNNELLGMEFQHRKVFTIGRDTRGREIFRQMVGGEVLSHSYSVRGLVQSQVLLGRRLEVGFVKEPIHRDYSYDVRGQLSSVIDSTHGSARYYYDPSERLIGIGKASESELYELDPTGNIARTSVQQAHSKTVVERNYDPGNRLVKSENTRFEYDSNGRLIKKIDDYSSASPRIWHYKWNGLSQLVSLTTADGGVWRYTYDAFGRRLTKSGPGKSLRYVWNKFLLLHEIDNATKQHTTWLFQPQAPFPLGQYRDKKFHSIICDQAGTPKELVDERGTVTRIERNAWGNPAGNLNSTAQCPLGFQGQYFDDESGLYYNRFRYYDPAYARFISQDPKSLFGGFNLYLYCPDPFRDVDPLGLDSRALDNALQGKPKDGQQAHHIIPEGVLEKNPQLEQAITPLGYNRDHPENGILLPSSDSEAQARNIPSHRGSHPNYNKEVGARVADINQRLVDKDITKEQAFDEIKALQKEYRKKIEDNDPSLPRSANFPCKLG
jgi:RHS repeat-associated protein